jgi:hypothetical protein
MNTSYSSSQRLLEYISIVLFVLLTGWGFWRLVVAAELQFFLVLLVTVPLVWLATDLLSGMLHWACDSFGSVNTPLVGNSFIRPFREHHDDPNAMTRHDFIETHGASCFAALPFLLVATLITLDTTITFYIEGFLLSLAIGGLATNQCHKWAHMDENLIPSIVRKAQRYHLLLPPQHHQIHHTPPYNSHFCMSNGWLNTLFNAVLKSWR